MLKRLIAGLFALLTFTFAAPAMANAGAGAQILAPTAQPVTSAAATQSMLKERSNCRCAAYVLQQAEAGW